MMNKTPELQAWADAHNVSLNTAFQYARFDIPGKVLQLGTTGDPRGIPLLQRALQSRNYLIVVWAAKGLALIQDKQSIPLIIAAAQKAPTGYNSLVAESLVYFDDAQAQSAVDNYMPKEKAPQCIVRQEHVGWESSADRRSELSGDYAPTHS